MMAKLLTCIRRKVVDRHGESLTEVLAAIAVSGLAILMLAVAISAAMRINVSSVEAMNRYYDANKLFVENRSSGSVTTASGSISLRNLDANTNVSLDAGNSVTFTISTDESIVSYEGVQP